MKLHLPLPLFRTLMGLFAIAAGASFTASGSVMKTQHATLLTYADFGQNMGRYVTGGNVNGLLAYIRQQEGGVLITYTDGTASNVLEHGMIDFSSVVQGGGGLGAGNLIAPNAYITAQHNGTFSPSFSATTVVGADNDILYQGIEYRNSKTMEIRSNASMDIKITRLNKLVTDAAPAAVYSGSLTREALLGQTVYHSGAGRQYVYNEEAGQNWWQANPGTFISGGVTELDGGDVGNTAYTVGTVVSVGDPALSPAAPLPYQPQDGDSGSPLFIWDAAANQFAYVGSFSAVNSLEATGGNTTYSKAIFDPQAMGNLDSFTDSYTPIDGHHTFDVGMGSEKKASVTETITTTVDKQTVSTTYTSTSYGVKIWDADGGYKACSVMFNRLENDTKDVYTWKALNAEMDKNNWFHYGSDYMNATQDATSKTLRTWSELYASRNNQFIATVGDTYRLNFTQVVDMGLGYARFSKEEGVEQAHFLLIPRSSSYASAQLLTSGYIVDKDVTLHLQFTNPENYVREWRKVGEGTLSIEGEGNNWVLLNVGGTGKTELNREKGFAAYNVLANTGSTVVINGINQIARDFTFGNGGAVLDFNGNSMTWNNGAKVADDGFTIHALTQEALITNNAETAVTLTVTNGGANFLGSFSDAGAGALEIDFNGTAWELNSIRTDLTHHDGSGLVVSSGDVKLAGMLTQHAAGTVEAGKTAAYSNADDWHYSDASMNVTVKKGGTFELGSHALLTGDVTVEQGGTYIMHEGVKHAQEYVEGGQVLEDTAKYSAFFGHKGDVELDGGAMKVQLSAGTDTDLFYDGEIEGNGSLTVDAGANGARVVLGGENSFTGARSVERGGLIAATEAALGSETWQVKEGAFIASETFEVKTGADVLSHISADSAGVLALTEASRSAAIDLSTHTKLGIGALQGHTVEYGTQGTELAAQNGQWHLGGGGGTLQVNASLNGDATLVLGTGNTSGTVVLAGEHNVMNGVAAAEGADMVLRGDFSLRDAGTITTGGTGSLLLENTAITNLGTSTVSGQVVFGDNVSVSGTLELTGAVHLQGGLVNNGTLIFNNATLDIANDSAQKLGTVYGAGDDAFGYTATGNGFRGEAVSVASSQSITGSGNIRMEGNSSLTYAGLAPTLTTQQGDTIMAVKSDADKLYYANTGVVTVGGAQATGGTGLASGFVVNADGTLNIAGNASSTLNTSSILLNTTGSGVLQLSTNASIASNTKTVFSGTLEVTNGATLDLGSGAGNGYGAANVRPDLYSLSSLVLKGGNIHYGAWGGFWLKNLVTEADARINVDSMGIAANTGSHHFVLQNVQLNKNLEINTKYYGSVQIDKIGGSGDLVMHGSSDPTWANTTYLSIASLAGFEGSIVMDRAMDETSDGKTVLAQANITAGDKDVRMKGMTFSDGVTATITVQKELSMESLDISKEDHGSTALTVKGGSVHVDNMNLGGGTLMLSNSAKLTAGDMLSVEAVAGGTYTLTGGKVLAGSISGVTLTDASVSLKDRLSYTVADMKMLGSSSLTVESGVVEATDSTLNNLTLKQNAAVQGSNITVTGDCHVEVAAAPVMLMTLAADGEDTPMVLYSRQLEGVTVAEGVMLTLNLDGILPQLTPTTTLYTVVFTDLTWETAGDIDGLITLQYGSWGTERELTLLSATHDADGTYLSLSIQAPEPATAALSLLALAGLAARRRRR